MLVLVACEESQAVCKEFRAKGHEAYSCDLEFCSGGYPAWHIWGNVSALINGACEFRTCDGVKHFVKRWDMILAFPPCTYLTKAGASNLIRNGELNTDRLDLGYQAAQFFKDIYNADCDKIVIENPVPMKRFDLPTYTQCVEPFYFGEPVTKKTYLWLKGVPYLCPTNVVKPIYTFLTYPLFKNSNGKYRQKNRSKTFEGVAKAMALTWG